MSFGFTSAPVSSVSADWLLEAMPIGLLVLDDQGRIQRLNQQLATWLGLPVSQLEGQPFAALPTAAVPAPLLLALQQLMAQGTVAPSPYLLPKAQQWVTLSGRSLAGQHVVYWQAGEPPVPPAAQPFTAELTAELNTYRALFEATDDGFCVIEMLFDEQDRPVDYRFLDTNPSFERQTGLRNVLGRCVSELAPALEQHWFEMYGHVALTGEPRHCQQWATDLHRWFDVLAFRIGEPAQRCVAVLFRDETSRKHIEDALRNSGEQFRLVANLVPDLLWTNTANGYTDWCNQRWLDYTGQTLEEVCGYGWVEAIHPDDRAESQRRFAAAVATGQALHLEHRIKSASGEYRWFLVQVVPFSQQDGHVTQWVGAATDVHELKLAEEAISQHKQQLEQEVVERTQALQESQALLHSVFEASINSVTVLEAVRDASGEIIDFTYVLSNQISRLYNNGNSTPPGTSYTTVHPGVRKTPVFETFKHVVATGQRLDMELYYGHEDINQWFRVVGAKLRDGLVVTAENITDRKTYEQEQTRSLHLLQQAEEVAVMGSWEYYPATRHIQWSAGMYHLYGWLATVPATPLLYLQYAAPESEAAARQLVAQLQAGEAGFEHTLRLRLDKAEKTVRVKAVLVPGLEGRPARLVGMDVDISERQRLEEENLRLRLTQQQELFAAVQQAREAERRRVAEGLHNGVGQILYATKLRLEQLAVFARQFTPEAKAAYQESSQLLGEAMRQIRGLSHELVPHILESFGLASAFLDIGHKLSSPQLRLDCRSTLGEEQNLSAALQLALYRMAQELAHNIAKHAQGATRARVQLESVEEGVLLCAEDNGIGFTSDPAQSTGLGLRSIRNQVELLGGTITIGAGAAGGASIRLYIPLTGPVIL
ncbi:PAS domain-containing sensor histidine kinase [Hymenobacter pini]|uniref:PAS domain-containing sensor histidine kinase n=1 Tax=Hymenobacter pini TaxID=2880879 RepID=UPI001CF38E54|nr:PAS domain S-box protein [Hymenobacter pini]MCA8829757.1 PAS domain S-box protein [Hymenobacter pini]